ncbi:MAG: hypothetical protein QM770_02650 [Tepidisphaeraceae bacterium]
MPRLNRVLTRQSSVAFNNLFEGLESRQLMSAAVHTSVESVSTSHDVLSAPVTKESAPALAIYVGTLTVGSKSTLKYALSILTDSAGQTTARVGGNGFGVTGDVVLKGTHTGNAYSLKYSDAKQSISVNFIVSDAGALTGTVSLTREGKTTTGTYTAQVLPPPVVTTKYNPMSGYITLPETGQKMLLKVTLTGDSTGAATATATAPILGGKEVKLTGTHNGNVFTFNNSVNGGTVGLSLTVGSDKKTATGTVTRVVSGKTITTSATVSTTAPRAPEPPPAPAPKTDVVLGKFTGNIVLPGSDRQQPITLTLLNSASGKVVLCLKTTLLATETRFVGERDGNTFHFNQQLGNASFDLSLTLSDDSTKLTGTMTRVAEGNVWPIAIDASAVSTKPAMPTDSFERSFTGTVTLPGQTQRLPMNLKLTASGDTVTLVGKSPILGNNEVTFTGTRSSNSFVFKATVNGVQLTFELSLSADGSTLAGQLTRVAEGKTLVLDVGLTAIAPSAKK